MLMIYLIRGYYPKYISSLYDLTPKKGKKKKNPVKKWEEDISRHFSKDIIDGNKHENMLNITNHQGNAN